MRQRLAGSTQRRARGLAIALGCAAALFAAAASPAAARNPLGGSSWLPPTPLYWPLVVDQSSTAPQTLTRGVTRTVQTTDTVGGRQLAQVLHVNLDDRNVRLGVVEAGDTLIDPSDETVSSMAHRTGAVAGVNGDFFAIQGDGDPTGMLIEHGTLVKSPNPTGHMADIGVTPDGRIVIGSETYTGTLTDGSSTYALGSVNTVDPELANSITRTTPNLGAVQTIPASTVVQGHLAPDGTSIVVDAVQTGQTSLPALTGDQRDLVGIGTGGSWLAQTVKAGDTVGVSESLSPVANFQTALSGGALLVRNGQMAVPITGTGENNINDPVTALGVDSSGRQATVAVFDGHQAEDAAEGLTRPQIAQWMIEYGAVNAILFDTGGSSEMVGRLPGQTEASVLNTPSDGDERPVANGLFFYSNEQSPGPATTAVVNGGRPLNVLTGTQVPVTDYATDALGNPSSEEPSLSATPGLATLSGTTLTAGATPGRGTLTVTAGAATSHVALHVLGHLGSLTVSPNAPDLDNGATQQLTLTARTGHGRPAALDPASVHWTVSPASLGSVDGSGLFTAATSGEGLATVTATAGGASATATIAVGHTGQTIDSMADVSNWSVSGTEGATASLSESTTELAQPTDQGSMDVHYAIPAGTGIEQVVFSPKSTLSFPAAGAAQDPDAIGLWVKGQGSSDDPSAPLAKGDLTLAESFAQINGAATTLYPTTVTYNGWRFVVAPIPAGVQFPLSVSFLDFLVEGPTQPMSGDLYVADLQALYAPRPVAVPPYVAVPRGPSWLSHVEDPASFTPGGTTLAAIGGAQLGAADPSSLGARVSGSLRSAFNALPRGARPSVAQTLGDMSASGAPADLAAAHRAITALRLPWHDAVGSGETSAGADPENVNDAAAFGATHQAYTAGSADVLVADDSQGGLTASDPFQSPDTEQYRWLVSQLSADSSPVTVVAMSTPAIDPIPGGSARFTDAYEAQEYEALLQRFARTHPATHVLALFGQGEGYREQVVDPSGVPDATGGVPNLQIGDLGTAPTAPADAGGFLDYGLIHASANGRVQFAVQPILDAVTIAGPSGPIRRGARVALSASGQAPTADGAGRAVPIADPASHVWSSSNPRVATVDSSTGALVARRTGSVTVSVTSGGVTGRLAVTVRRR